MSAETTGHEVDRGDMVGDGGMEPMDQVTPPDELPEDHLPRRALPWIGALPNPHLGPMVVLNDSGYLVPLWTAGELLRGCRYFWQESRE